MSDAPQARTAARAAGTAAAEIERLLAEAGAAVEQMKAEARRDLQQIRRQAEREADEITAKARAEAIRLGQEARSEAEDRVAAAQAGADEVLEEARALSRGLRQLAGQLTDHAGRILSDVQAAQRRMSTTLRAATGPAVERPAVGRARPAPGADSPFEDLEVPTWMGD